MSVDACHNALFVKLFGARSILSFADLLFCCCYFYRTNLLVADEILGMQYSSIILTPQFTMFYTSISSCLF